MRNGFGHSAPGGNKSDWKDCKDDRDKKDDDHCGRRKPKHHKGHHHKPKNKRRCG